MTTKELRSRAKAKFCPLPKLEITERRIGEIHPYIGNPRAHTPKQVRRIAESIREFGFTNPILIDDKDIIVAGHARWEAAGTAGLTHVPVIRLGHLSQAQRKALLIADNRLAEISSWDRDLLATELASISEIDAEFDIELTGFDIDEIALVLDGDASASLNPEDDNAIPTPHGPAITRAGDLWLLGPHKLFCGDATQRSSYLALLDRERARMVFTDPPYNVPISGHVSGLGKHKHREFMQASGELSEAEFGRFLTTSQTLMSKASQNGSLHYICMDWRHSRVLLNAGAAVYDELKNICVWAKSNFGMGSLYRSQHELVFVFKKGKRPHINNVELGKHGRSRSNLWEYAGANSFSKTRDQELAMHPTVKPLAMVADAILDASDRGDLILDPFAGSGTTLMAAEQTDRIARLVELDPLYCDVILRRFEQKTGVPPVHAATQKTFAQLAASRGEGGDR